MRRFHFLASSCAEAVSDTCSGSPDALFILLLLLQNNNEKLSQSIEQQTKNLDQKMHEIDLKNKEIGVLREDKQKLYQEKKEDETRLNDKMKEQYRELLDLKARRPGVEFSFPSFLLFRWSTAASSLPMKCEGTAVKLLT